MIRITEPAKVRRVLAGCLAAFAVMFLTESAVDATKIFDPAEAPFDNAECFDLPPAGMPPGALEHQFMSNGVSFGFESTSGNALDAFGPDGIVVVSFGGPESGVVVTASPPVPAIGFFGEELDGCPGGTFIGAQDNEEIVLDEQPSSSCVGFYGAAGIGNIGTVNLHNFNAVFKVTELCYVPPTMIPDETADMSVVKSASDTAVLNGVVVTHTLTVQNEGPGTADGVRVIDFPPENTFTDAQPTGNYDPDANAIIWNSGEFGQGTQTQFEVNITTPAGRTEFSCDHELVNVAVVNSSTLDPELGNNLDTSTVRFDNAAVRGPGGSGEICGNGIDDECDGFFECADSECDCRPTLPPGPGGDPQCWGGIIEGPPGEPPIIIDTMCNPVNNNSDNHSCTVPRGRCGGVTVPAYCCDPATWSNPSNNGSAALARCDVGVPGCAPVDPNFKESDPTVNIAGYGLTEAGRTMTYTIHYENIGTADALNVQILDSLDPDLDDTTLAINDGGVYNPATRTIVWTDPVVPPSDPRTVSFQINVRDDATPGTRLRNVGTIIFPNADPPTRIDTYFVEHVVTDPSSPIEPDLRVLNCMETPPDSGMWKVYLVNEGSDFAYNVTAEIINPPPGVNVNSGVAAFAHMDDEDPDVLATVIPNATTMSREPIAFDTQTPGDPCGALMWLIQWENLQGDISTRQIRSLPDRDNDAVPDDEDNCPDDANSDQADSNENGVGDVCDDPEPPAFCDIDGDGDVDITDIMRILVARNTPASGPDDPRDRDGDGWITVLDARRCVLECSFPRCISPPP